MPSYLQQNTLNSNSKPRFDWLDALKAFAMLLVIFGHLGLNTVTTYQVYASFIKLPLFFAASGFVFNPAKNSDIKQIVASRIKRIMIPYLCLSLSLSLISLIRNGFDFSNFYYSYIETIVVGRVMWFLPTLFCCNILMAIVFKVCKNKDFLIVLTAFVSIILGYILLPESHVYMNLNVVLIAYPFCILGYYIKKYVLKINKKVLIPLSIVLVLFYLIVPYIYKQFNGFYNYVNLYENYYASYALDMLVCFAGTFGVFVLASFLKYPKPIVWFGKNTLFYYAYHPAACAILIDFLHNYVFNGLTLDYLKGSHKGTMVYCMLTLLTLLLLVPICLLVNKFLPEIVGLPRVKKQNKSSQQ